MEAYDHYKPTESGYASCRDHFLAVRCLRAIRAEQKQGGLMSPGGGNFWSAVGTALWTLNPTGSVHIVLTHKTACTLGFMLENDLIRHMEQALCIALHRGRGRGLTTWSTDTSSEIPVVDEADLDLMSWLTSVQPGISGEHISSGQYCATAAQTLITPSLAELCPEEFETTAQAQMIQRCARRAGIVKYTGAFADAIWRRLLRRTARVLQRCALALVTNLPHEPATWSEPSTLAPGEPFAMYEQRVVPPPRATRFQANSVEDDSDDEDEGEGEELTETEDEDDHWRVQARSGPAAKSTSLLRVANTLLTCARGAL